MGWRALKKEIIDYIHAQLTQGGDGGDPVVTLDPNGFYLDEDLEKTTRPTSGVFLAYYIRMASAQQVATPAPLARERRRGLLMFICYIGLQKGTKRSDTLADRVADAFRGVKLSTTETVWFGTPLLSDERQEDEHWRVNVSCPFMSDAFN